MYNNIPIKCAIKHNIEQKEINARNFIDPSSLLTKKLIDKPKIKGNKIKRSLSYESARMTCAKPNGTIQARFFRISFSVLKKL